MSSDEAAGDAQELEHAVLMILPADSTFDGRDRVMSLAAWELCNRGTAHSAVHGHAGFVPDDYLAGLGTQTTISAAELCTAGMWKRVPGGYRVLDWEAVEVCIDRVRELKEGNARARARERERDEERQAQMAQAMVIAPPCAVCGTPSARIELVAPGGFPAEWERWPSTVQGTFLYREPRQWYLLFKGVAAGNGYGDPITAGRAGRIVAAFRLPLHFAQVHTAGFYDDAGFCQVCDAPYCYQHWHVSQSSYGYCPHGHGKSLDPHWSP